MCWIRRCSSAVSPTSRCSLAVFRDSGDRPLYTYTFDSQNTNYTHEYMRAPYTNTHHLLCHILSYIHTHTHTHTHTCIHERKVTGWTKKSIALTLPGAKVTGSARWSAATHTHTRNTNKTYMPTSNKQTLKHVKEWSFNALIADLSRALQGLREVWVPRAEVLLRFERW